jgi:hypothetical protein
MEYHRPRMISWDKAVIAIQSGEKMICPNHVESMGTVNWCTLPAYEADE